MATPKRPASTTEENRLAKAREELREAKRAHLHERALLLSLLEVIAALLGLYIVTLITRNQRALEELG
jgi:hypothetical protein